MDFSHSSAIQTRFTTALNIDKAITANPNAFQRRSPVED
jgi:hypothetical protein